MLGHDEHSSELASSHVGLIYSARASWRDLIGNWRLGSCSQHGACSVPKIAQAPRPLLAVTLSGLPEPQLSVLCVAWHSVATLANSRQLDCLYDARQYLCHIPVIVLTRNLSLVLNRELDWLSQDL